MNLKTTWLATFTVRWHSNPYLAPNGTRQRWTLRKIFTAILLWLLRKFGCAVTEAPDTVGWHSARVENIIEFIWPDASPALLKAARKHDLAESVVGDLPPAGKSMLPNAATAERLIATQNGWHVPLQDPDGTRLRFADRLDAFMWADHHRATDTDEWHDAREMLVYQAERLGVRGKLEGVL